MTENPVMSTLVIDPRKRQLADDYNSERSPKRQAVNGENGDVEYGENFAHHLQTHIQGDGPGVASMTNDHSSDVPNAPYPLPEQQHNGFDMTNHQGSPYGYAAYKPADEVDTGVQVVVQTTPRAKPQVGSQEWHQNRKDCHKEVERRRRETINEGIMALANIVPDCEKAKGAILNRTVSYVQELRATITALHAEMDQTKGTLEGLLTQMTDSNTELQREKEIVSQKNVRLKAKLLAAGIADEEDEEE